MRGSHVGERVRRHVDAQNEALNCVADGRLVAWPDEAPNDLGSYEVQLTRGSKQAPRLLPLRGDEALLLDVRQKVLVGPMHEFTAPLIVIAYTYRLLLASADHGAEVVAFHWTPEAEPPQRSHPHMHVGSLVTVGSRFRPKDFNRLHIPTGPITLEAVLLFAVEELGVEPARGRDRAAVVDQLRAAVGKER